MRGLKNTMGVLLPTNAVPESQGQNSNPTQSVISRTKFKPTQSMIDTITLSVMCTYQTF